MTIHRIRIIGCGWLGLPLGEKLSQLGYRVSGTTTRKEKLATLEAHQISPVFTRLDPDFNPEPPAAFFDADLVFILIPPGVRKYGHDFHPRQVKAIAASFPDHVPFIYASSTSVYDTRAGDVWEEDVCSAKDSANPTLGAAEELIRTTRNKWQIVRFGGLMGYERNPGRYFSGKQYNDGQRPVNYIHCDDAVRVLLALAKAKVQNQVWNAVAPKHPVKSEVARVTSQKYGYEPPTFTEGQPGPYKIVHSDKLRERIDFQFHYPDPLKFSYTA